MAKYTVVKAFRDFEDKLPNGEYHTYYEGDKYPRTGRANEERAALLSSKKNKRKEIVIKEVVEEQKEENAKEEQKEEATKEEVTKEVVETKAKKAEDEKAKKEAAK